MSSNLSNYATNKILDCLMRGEPLESILPVNWYLALYSTACSNASPGTELSGGSYSRAQLARTLAAWKGTHDSVTGVSTGTTGIVKFASNLIFPTPTADWQTATDFAIMDAATGGNHWWWGHFTTPRTVLVGDIPAVVFADALQLGFTR